jgi:CubicO group peptidase (beta-lactamase class C family)
MAPQRTVTLANWMDWPHNRIAFQRVRELTPTALITRRGDAPLLLPRRPVELDAVDFARADGSRTTWGEHLEATQCDAVCVVHRGEIVYERYFNGMTEHTPHLLMSVSKSFCGAALGIAIGRGRLSVDDLVCDVAPEFAGTSLDGATVRHVIDMTAGTDFVEDYELYADPEADNPLLEYERQAGYRPLGARTPVGTLGHFRTYGLARPHGAWFDYRSPLTNIAARLLEVVEDMRYPDIVSRDLWGPLGQEHDADIMLDPLGHPVVEGGMSCTLRDLARFGLAYLGDGAIADRQVVPADWVRDTREGDDAAVAAFRDTEPGWSMYRNAFWVMQRGAQFSGLGIFGQFCWVDRPTQTVIARFSTFPTALPFDTSAEVQRAMNAVATALG